MTKRSERCTLRQWGVYRKLQDAVKSQTYGDLCSLRWTWFSRSESEAYIGVLAELLDVSQELAGGRLKRLHIEQVNKSSSCFALAEIGEGIVAEFEVNEALPASVPDARFVVADFTEGRVTNRPLTGFHHGEGAFLGTNEGVEAILFEPVPVLSGEPLDGDILEIIARALKGEA